MCSTYGRGLGAGQVTASRQPAPRSGEVAAAGKLAAAMAQPSGSGHHDPPLTGNLALLGLVSAVMLGSSCLAQLAARRGAPPAQAQAGGLTLLALGLLALVLAAPLHAGALLILGAVLAGAGHGLAFLAAQDDLTQIAPPEQRAEVSAAFGLASLAVAGWHLKHHHQRAAGEARPQRRDHAPAHR